MKNIFKIAILLLTIVSCSSNNSEDTLTPKNQPVLVAIKYQSGNIAENYQNGRCISDFLYNYYYQGPNGLLSKRAEKDRPSFYSTYAYNADLTLKSSDVFYGSPTSGNRYVYSYQSGIINEKIYAFTNLNNFVYQNNFMVQNNLIMARYYSNSSNPDKTYEYDNKGNMTSYLTSSSSFSATYDNKPSAAALKLKGMFGDNYKTLAVLTGVFDNHQLTNNALTESTIYSNASYYYSYQYLYGKTNYPIKLIEKNQGYFIDYVYSY